MLKKIKDIFVGWRNHLFPKKNEKEFIQIVSDLRIKICRQCEFNSINKPKIPNYPQLRNDEHCTLCGCTLIAKTKNLESSCPDVPSRWKSIHIHNKK